MRNDVLIIGAGPSGLFAAAELARHGVAARLVEREVRPHREARATAIQPGTLEILDSVGVLAPFLDAAEHVHCARLYGPDMIELGAMRHDGIDCRCKFQCSLPQYETASSRPISPRSAGWSSAASPRPRWRPTATRSSSSSSTRTARRRRCAQARSSARAAPTASRAIR